MGHENLGIVTAVGSKVTTVKLGDRVVVNAFENKVIPNGGTQSVQIFGAGDYGLGSPEINGGQAEYMRVPFSDDNLLVLSKGKEHELDYLLLADIFPTSWYCLESAGQVAGDTVVVFGAGEFYFDLLLGTCLQGNQQDLLGYSWLIPLCFVAPSECIVLIVSLKD